MHCQRQESISNYLNAAATVTIDVVHEKRTSRKRYLSNLAADMPGNVSHRIFQGLQERPYKDAEAVTGWFVLQFRVQRKHFLGRV
jgi:hypothetical protein